jgi:serine/threonine protein kinase
VESIRPPKEEKEVTTAYNCVDDLTEEEYKNFGDRFPVNFVKAALLGRGGFSLVWLGIQRKTKKRLAIKQILTKNPHQTHLKEIWFGNYFFTAGGEPREEFADHIGVRNICRLLAYDIRPVDTWLFYELCEDSLGNSLYELRSDHSSGEDRSYTVFYKPLLFRFREDPTELKHLLVELCKTLMLLNAHNIVHSDLKT